MRDAFISYSTTDSAEAYSVRNFLQRSGCTCWMAPDDISAGSDYAEAIPKAIADCRTFVLILSPDAQNSNWVRKELGKALDKGKTVIPFMLRDFKLNDTFDFLLENAQWCHAYNNRDAALQKLLAAVKAQQGTYRYTPHSTATPPKQPTPPPKPTVAQAKPRSTASTHSSSKAISRLIYSLVIWGTFCTISALLIGVSYFLSQRTAMDNGAFFIMAIGMLALIILMPKFHKYDLFNYGINAAIQGNFIQKFLLWLVLGVGIFVTLVILGGLSYLQITAQDSFTPNQVTILAVISGILSLLMMTGWLKKYDF